MSNPYQERPEHAGDRTVEAPAGHRPGPPPAATQYPGRPQAHPQQYAPPQYPQRPATPPVAPPAAAVLPSRFWLKLYAVTLAAVLTGGVVLMFAGYQLVNWKIDQLSDDVRSDLGDLDDSLGGLGLPGLGG